MRNRDGVTLLELMVVVVIVGILAAVGVPQFLQVRERGFAADALYALGEIRASQLRYTNETSLYWVVGALPPLDIAPVANTQGWTFAAGAAEAAAMGAGIAGPNITATRTAVGGGVAGTTILMDLNTGAACSVTAAYRLPATVC